MTTLPRIAIAALLLSVSLAACLETTGGNALVEETASKTKAAKTAAKQPSLAVTRSSANSSAKSNPADQVRAELLSQCTTEHGGLFGDDKVSKQCACYADTAVKNMGKDGLDYYLQYRIVPTVTGPRPEEMKTACGIANVLPANKSGRPAPPPGG